MLLEPGDHIWWTYGDRFVRPMRVVRDDADGLVAWLAPGTPIVLHATADGRHIRDLPLDQRFRTPWSSWHGHWRGAGVLKIAPAGMPWSVWLFWGEGWEHRGWYVNLEDPHTRDGRWTRTRDHVLDVWVDARRTVQVKDADELAAAVAAGRFTPAQARRLHATADEAIAAVARWGSPFRDGWEWWRPDPAWAAAVPPLPAAFPDGTPIPAATSPASSPATGPAYADGTLRGEPVVVASAADPPGLGMPGARPDEELPRVPAPRQ